MPIDPAINIIRRKLELDQELHLRTPMKVEQIISLLELCLGAAMGSPISLIVANLYMEDYETMAINTAEYPPRIWKRYVDDTFVVIDAVKKAGFLEHINSIDPHIHSQQRMPKQMLHSFPGCNCDAIT